MAKVIVGMSGGVDSAVCAYLLKAAGYVVIGVTLKTWVAADGKESRCCEIDDARLVADQIGIPYYAVNCISEFQRCVIDPFVQAYIHGLTPNPCIGCNRYIKWDRMLDFAKSMQAEYIATGHYASVVQLDNGRYTVKQADHIAKDQTYMLYKLSQEQLAHTLMPLGKLTKEQVRAIAVQAGISVAQKPDSQEICFVPEGNYADYIEENAECDLPPEGNFVDEEGKVLGRHKGIIHYTVGQRKGLGIALGEPAYVKEIRTETNEVVLAPDSSLYSDTVVCGEVNFMSIAPLAVGEKIRCLAKIRYHHTPQSAELEMLDEDTVQIRFDAPVRAVTPGQSAVFYDEDHCVMGGGVIK
ncbi:MAG: tRNA 2-thiouridine(34) synthase MnmA [Lachnospiraceae bacterium]|nr:tRNA 2-thiouridine(34) synthase MnmA [Lachnospiraceae bacterium]